MWLYLPSDILVSARDTAGSTLACPWPSETPCELWVTLSGKPQRRPLSWRGWKTRPWIRRLSGMTLKPSTAERGAALWILSLRDSPASRGASPGSGREPKTPAGSGRLSFGSLWTWEPGSCSWKTSQASLPGMDLNTSCPTLPRTGSMRNGCVSARERAVPATGGNECSSWPTSRSEDAEFCGGHRGATDSLLAATRAWPTPDSNPEAPNSSTNRGARWGGRRRRLTPCGLGNAAKQWPTPKVQDTKHTAMSPGEARRDGPCLASKAAIWPTPKTPTGGPEGRESKAARGAGGEDLLTKAQQWHTPRAIYGEHPGMSDRSHLTGQAQWATPRANEANQQNSRDAGQALSRQAPASMRHGPPSSPSTPTSPRRYLNPRFVEWLMGPPVGWTGSGCSATEWCRYRRLMRSALLRLVSRKG